MSFILIVGAGRVGSTVARTMLANGHDVSVLDEDPLSHERLDSGMDTTWEDAGGRFTLGHGLEIDALREAGIEEADAVVVSTDGDNSNIVIGQMLQLRYGIGCVVVRIFDPRRADFYAERGLRTVCPTKTSIATLADIVRACDAAPVGSAS